MLSNDFTQTPPQRILVITLRYLGDTLLTTPLIHALRQAYPQALIDVLTYPSNVAMLAGNPDIHALLTLDKKPKLAQFGRFLLSLFRRYDLAISTQAGDRPTLCAILAGKRRIGFTPPPPDHSAWKRLLLTAHLVGCTENHAVLENLRLCSLLGILPEYRVTPPAPQPISATILAKPFAVVHLMPQWRYKQWHIEGWLSVCRFIHGQGLNVVLTGSALPHENQIINQIAAQLADDTLNLAGQLSLSQLTELISHARFFIGPDTGITHLAAATGTPTFAIFGPTNPQQWGPWPKDYAGEQSPFKARGCQSVNNVHLIQGYTSKNCLPCQQEGCEKHRDSFSECLDNLSAQSVIDTIRAKLI